MRADCRTSRSTQRSAFTLVEILIVVIILGILATIIIGIFGNTTKDAGGASLKDNLRSIRSAIQIYSAQHGRYPAQATFEAQMTQYTNTTGATSTTRTGTYSYGPYILTLPPLPVGTDKGATTVTTTTYQAGHGWQYDATSGTFKANCPDTDKDDSGVAYNTY
jgi:prepilin-type N-terminal cleavage/methylation domain-containing protein